MSRPAPIDIRVKPWRALDEAERSAYAEVVAACSWSSVFHSCAWHDAMEQAGSPAGVCALARRGDDVVGAFVYYSLAGPWPGRTHHSCLRDREMVYGGPVAAGEPGEPADGSLAVLDGLLARFESGPRVVAAWVLPPPDFPEQALASRGYRLTRQLTALLGLPALREDLWNAVHPKTRNMIRKALRSGLSVREASPDDLALVPGLIAEPFRRAGRRPPEASLILSVARMVAAGGGGRVLVAAPGESAQPVAAGIFLRHRDRSYYWASGASAQGSESAAGHLIQWAGIEAARASGCAQHDMVMLDPARAPGIARFKLRFGAVVSPVLLGGRRRLSGRVLGRAWRIARGLRALLPQRGDPEEQLQPAGTRG